jgi:ParB family chromosome partitioning protein
MDFDAEKLQELVVSIKTHGVLQPILCRRLKTGGYELIAGERRLRAAIEAGLTHIPAILEDADDRAAAEIAVIENIQRADLNIIEEAEGYKTLADTFNLTHQEIADRVGKPRPSISNTLRLLDLTDEAKQLLATGHLTTGHAKVLLGVASPVEQTLLARKCVSDALTVRMTERLLAQREKEKEAAPKRQPESDLPEAYVRDLVDRLHRHFGTAVRLLPGVTYANGKHAKGSIQIDFFSNEELERLLEVLGVEVQ